MGGPSFDSRTPWSAAVFHCRTRLSSSLAAPPVARTGCARPRPGRRTAAPPAPAAARNFRRDIARPSSCSCIAGAPRLARSQRSNKALEAGALGRIERARPQPRSRTADVVIAGCDVVRSVGIQQRRQDLDVPATDSELELAAAVQTDAGL